MGSPLAENLPASMDSVVRNKASQARRRKGKGGELERPRLFHVSIAREERIVVTWNTGRQGDATPSLAFSALMGLWESEG